MGIVQEANAKLGSDFIHPQSKGARMLQLEARAVAVENAAGKVCSTEGRDQVRMVEHLKSVMARSLATF
jgi:hypothetical protein